MISRASGAAANFGTFPAKPEGPIPHVPQDRATGSTPMSTADAQIAEIRAILAAFDWEHDDRKYALERIEMIVATDDDEQDG